MISQPRVLLDKDPGLALGFKEGFLEEGSAQSPGGTSPAAGGQGRGGGEGRRTPLPGPGPGPGPGRPLGSAEGVGVRREGLAKHALSTSAHPPGILGPSRHGARSSTHSPACTCGWRRGRVWRAAAGGRGTTKFACPAWLLRVLGRCAADREGGRDGGTEGGRRGRARAAT